MEDSMPQAALVIIHGMGETPPDYATPLFAGIRTRLEAVGLLGEVSLHAVYYEDILRPNQEMVWARTNGVAKLHYDDLRRFLLFGFGDAAGLEDRKEVDGSVYEMAQGAIARQMLDAYREAPGAAVVFLAQSLGCQVLSSYLYDAQKALAGVPVVAGIWKDVDAWAARTLGRALAADEKAFIGGATCTGMLTTGCNIPIFVAAHRVMDIIPITPPTPGFKWINIYDPDDALGWPLAPLSPEYAALVEDRQINAGQGMVNWIVKSWNPLSHLAYWSDDKVLDAVDELLLTQVG
jgi:hypothetical protein